MIVFLVCGFFILFAGSMAITALTMPMSTELMGGNFEQIALEKIVFSSNNSATLTVTNYGYTTSIINSAIINGKAALLDTCQAPSGIPKHYSVNYFVTLQSGTLFTSNTNYQFKLVTTKGTSTFNNAFYDPTAIAIAQNHTHSTNPIIAPSPKPFYFELPDYSLPFTIAFALILLFILAVAAKHKSFRKYSLILTPIGIAEFALLLTVANYPYLFFGSQFRLDRYGDFVFAISLVSIVGGVTIYLLNRIAPALVQKKIKVSLIMLGYTAMSIGGIGLYLPWETGFSIIFRMLTFIFGIYLSIIGTANYFINKPKESEVLISIVITIAG